MSGRRSAQVQFWSDLSTPANKPQWVRVGDWRGAAQVTGRTSAWFRFFTNTNISDLVTVQLRELPTSPDYLASAQGQLTDLPGTLNLLEHSGSGVTATFAHQGFRAADLGFSAYEEWWEWTENFVITFAERIKAQIDGDATIQAAYAPKVIIQLNDDLQRFEANAKLKHNIILIHSLRSMDKELFGSGRYNRPLRTTITFYTRSDKGAPALKEINLTGDGTAARPGLYEIAEDVKALLTANYLELGGQRYLWKIELGEIVPEDVLNEQYKGHIVKASMLVTGHKFEYDAG